MDLTVQPPSAHQQPVSVDIYGLAEEKYADNPFHLLIICIFLNRTPGERALPKAREFIEVFTTPEKLSKASVADVEPFFAHLGLPQRAKWLIRLAEKWINLPPKPNVKYPKYRYKKFIFESEVAHLTGVGRYASDAWRIFCKDTLYQEAGYPIIEPEWRKVIPEDKELSSYLVWKWKKEGYIWNPETGERTKQSTLLADQVNDELPSEFAQRMTLQPARSPSPSPYTLRFPGGQVEIPKWILASAEVLR